MKTVMNLKEREELCNECLDFIIRVATITKEDANEGAFQKSGELRQIANHINEVLVKIDGDNK